jgi:fluoride exporter
MFVQCLGGSGNCPSLSPCGPCVGTRIAQLSPKNMVLSILVVFLGGAVGSMWRFWWSGLVAQRYGETFPFGTLIVNIVGSTIIGFCAGFLMHVSNSGLATALQQLLVVGICGGLTTFSSFSLQTYSLIADRRWLSAISNIVFSTALSFGFLSAGWQIAQAINS